MSEEMIDWAQAPEGTTHAHIANQSYPWRKQQGGVWFAWCEPEGWVVVCDPQPLLYREKPEAWTGAGLPPVGTACEVDYREKWQPCQIIAHFQQRAGMVAAFTVDLVDGVKSLDAFTAGNFRPLRTPEQLAAEAREASVKQMMKDVCCASARDIFEDLYDAGYRKVDPAGAQP